MVVPLGETCWIRRSETHTGSAAPAGEECLVCNHEEVKCFEQVVEAPCFIASLAASAPYTRVMKMTGMSASICGCD
jgi:hypothetical protein